MTVACAPSEEKPRIGFLGVGWIGLDRMKALAASGLVDVAAIADPSAAMLDAARAEAPRADTAHSLDDLLSMHLDGIVVATPSALHAAQSIAALEAGKAVFCQKPLGRTVGEVAAVVAAARRADRLLDVDLSYRHTEGMRRIRDLVRKGDLGSVHAADLHFHNSYGPDKAWFHDPELSGGGCLIDLGTHLVDLALWTLDHPPVIDLAGRMWRGGEMLEGDPATVEDYATATLLLAGGTEVRIACSWNLHAGQDADIAASFHGRKGGCTFRNVSGSFYDFRAHHHTGTSRRELAAPPDAWGGRAIVDWARRLVEGHRFDPRAERHVEVARVLDGLYGRSA